MKDDNFLHEIYNDPAQLTEKNNKNKHVVSAPYIILI